MASWLVVVVVGGPSGCEWLKHAASSTQQQQRLRVRACCLRTDVPRRAGSHTSPLLTSTVSGRLVAGSAPARGGSDAMALDCVNTMGTRPDRNSRATSRPSDTRPPLHWAWAVKVAVVVVVHASVFQ